MPIGYPQRPAIVADHRTRADACPSLPRAAMLSEEPQLDNGNLRCRTASAQRAPAARFMPTAQLSELYTMGTCARAAACASALFLHCRCGVRPSDGRDSRVVFTREISKGTARALIVGDPFVARVAAHLGTPRKTECSACTDLSSRDVAAGSCSRRLRPSAPARPVETTSPAAPTPARARPTCSAWMERTPTAPKTWAAQTWALAPSTTCSARSPGTA